ncbi:MAG TPA: hypothetical protein VF486_01360 [Actinomycetes bacterium]
MAATLLILRATELLTPGRGHDRAAAVALGLYTAYNLAATPASVLAAGVGLFALAYAGFAVGGTGLVLLAGCFVAAGVAIGCVETAGHTAVAALVPRGVRGSAFGLLAAVQSLGNFAASAVAGVL